MYNSFYFNCYNCGVLTDDGGRAVKKVDNSYFFPLFFALIVWKMILYAIFFLRRVFIMKKKYKTSHCSACVSCIHADVCAYYMQISNCLHYAKKEVRDNVQKKTKN